MLYEEDDEFVLPSLPGPVKVEHLADAKECALGSIAPTAPASSDDWECIGAEVSQESKASADFERIPSACTAQLPEREPTAASVRVCTWNVAEIDSSLAKDEDLAVWLGLDDPPDFLAIGLQEIDMSGKALLFSETQRGNAWCLRLSDIMECSGLVLLPTRQLMGLLLLVFVRRPLVPHIQSVEVASCGVGWLGVAANKGGVVLRCKLDGKYYCFVNSHLAAHTHNVETRNENYHSIHAKISFNQKPRTILGHDYVFWFGDLNYRVDLRRELFDELLELDDEPGEDGSPPPTPEARLLEYDQLTKQRVTRSAFGFFHEAKIQWAPTFKYRGREYAAHRVPSYCDRVLWFEREHALRHGRCNKSDFGATEVLTCPECLPLCRVHCLAYQSFMEFWESDHKPVAASFVIRGAKGTAPT
eukprot:TRINITY_DN15222_c0_g1_i1.p1 TRINITY_DN15222_c0_g1~~TRINITY_DN15222_c0_g1_i1.p1  ORF type:complete len:416 (+),score=84.77 TRINITY_DN15222_c0_g1_i1:23-1270(+)